MAISVDPDQTLHSVTSDQGIHCLIRHVLPKRERLNEEEQQYLHQRKLKNETNNKIHY